MVQVSEKSESVEPLPVPIWKWAMLATIWMAWLTLTDWNQKRNSFLAGCVFAVVETVWTFLSSGKGYTTFSQFWVLALYFPIIVEPYRISVQTNMGKNVDLFIRVLFYPFLIWFLEICEGYLLMFMFGRNTAWEYEHEPPRIKNSKPIYAKEKWIHGDILFHGNIRLGHFKLVQFAEI